MKYEKDSPFCYWVLKFDLQPIEVINGYLYFTQHWDEMVKFL